MERSGIITLTTDFGLVDGYAAVLHGVIWSIFPQARIVDLSHEVRPQQVLQGAFLLASAWRYFPRGTVHLAVVDPGVGTLRGAIAVETPHALFVAPDNGLLSGVWEELDAAERAASRIVELTEPRYWLPHPSFTFHGRDIFAPVAAHLAAGVPLEALGRPRQALVVLEEIRPQILEDGTVLGRIVHIDRFGNLISNIGAEMLIQFFPGGKVRCEAAGRKIAGPLRTYAEGPADEPFFLIGSHNRLEIAVRNGSAARLLNLTIGDPVRLCPGRRL